MNQPSEQQPGSMESIEQLIRRFERRLRTQRLITGLIEGGCLGLMIGGVSVAAVRTGWAEPDRWWLWIGMAIVFTVAGGVLRALQPIDAVAAAQQIDRAHGLHDRLSTAISLARKGDLSTEDDAFVRAQLHDAIRHIDDVDPRRAAPWRRPPDLLLMGLVGLAVLTIGLLPLPDHEEPLPPPFEVTYGQILDDATIALERDRLRELQRRLEELPDDEAQELADEIEALLDAVEARRISEREFVDRIDELLQDYFDDDASARDLDTLTNALAEAAMDTAAEHLDEMDAAPAELEEAMQALEDGDFQAAADALSEMAERFENEGIDPDEAEELAEFLEAFADHLEGREERLQDLFEEHRDSLEELMDQFEAGGDVDEQLLEDMRQAAEEAEQQRDDFSDSDAKRQLERLSRELEETADDLRNQADQDRQDEQNGDGQRGDDGDDRDGPARADEDAPEDQDRTAPSDQGRDDDSPDYRNEIGRQLDDASRQLEEMERQRQRQQNREQAQRQLEEMRESMSRGSRQDSEQDRRRGEQMEDFMERARGEDGDRSGQEESSSAEDGAESEGEASQTADGGDPQDGGEGGEEGEGADAAGQGGPDDDSLLDGGDGDDDVEFAHRDEELTGQESEEGLTRSEIIQSASEEGFATVEYQDVYADYEAIAEEVMDREEVPDGYRYYIKRYFQLIRPQQ